uniref:Serpentine receptor class gamma n=1 Tax=Meloidogyne floridensis TaxID=298350 RepID=A0A915NTX4_9BILA
MGFFLSAPIVFLANTVYLPFVISLVIGVPSVILYSFEVVIIITKWKDYNSSFFQLFIARAILNILNFIFFFVQRFGKVGLFTNIYLQLPSWVLATTFFFGYYCIHGENIATTLQLLDRLSSILWPFTYEKAWNRLLPFAILLIFILPLARTIQIFSYDLYARLQADNQTITIAIRNIETLDINPAEDAAYSCVIFMFICLIINIATLFVYKTKVQSQTTKIASNGLQKAIEKRLILYAFWTFVGQLLISISTTLIYISVMIAIAGYTLLSYDENQNFYLVK